MRVLISVCFALVRRSEDPVVDEQIEMASVTPDAHVQVVRGEGSSLLEAQDGMCCGLPDAASSDHLLVCKARSEAECSGEDAVALDEAQCQDAPPCVVDPVGPGTTGDEPEDDQELAEGETEPEADPGVGDSCNSDDPDSCGDGLVCSRGVCKYAAMEKCTPTWFSSSNCASHPYGSGHKFQCKTHRKSGDKRCCIPSGPKHVGSASNMLSAQRPLTLKQYQAAHPHRKETKDGKGISIKQVEEPQAYLINYKTKRVRAFRREIVPGTGTWVHGKQKVILTDACCSGWATYGRQGVTGDIGSDIEKKAEKRWFCGY